ncbi:tyrosine-type recombinase/integrase [Streptomyces sp. GS7]|uniref:tyrosine-type recombinase/integrase n=1 Tax=Streptomyces sp. GS7 TaxID=2692234 RepID=UPI0013177E36|nr:site-specific integrase [Streptomyces sp. GS7]QHC25660.1 tyrosine-type recombinase/integrase [Streptomyces sp. GS7]
MATVYQRCKSDKRNVNYPCTKPRCGHPWTVRYREPAGAERQPSFEKKSQADAFADRLQHDKYEGLYLDPKRGEVTLRAYAAEWLERQVISDSTYRNYESFLRIHLLPRLGGKTIAGVESKDVEAFVAALGKNLASSTVCDRMKMVTSLFQTAIKEKRRADDPTEGIKLPRSATHAVDEDEIPTLYEVDLIAKQISPQYRLTVYLQAGAGLRISETLAFTTDCVRSDFLRVRRQVSAKAHRDDCKTRFIPLKHRAEGEYRDVPLPAFLAEEIDAHLWEWGTVPTAGMEVLFAPRDRGKGIMPTANTYAYHFRKALKAAGIVKPDGNAKYTPHGLRHFFASTALAHGIPIHEVSRWLGHKSIKTTVDVYGHLVPASWDRCRTVMQTALRPGSHTT